MSLAFEPRTIFKDTPDREALLVSQDHQLIAMLVRLSAVHGELEGSWYIDWAFRDEMMTREPFAKLETASDWIADQLGKI